MEKVRLIATVAAMLALPGAAWATDCSRWSDHAPGYCGVLGNDTQCANPANRVPGRCAIPAASWYVDSGGRLIDNRSQSVMAAAGSYTLIGQDGNGLRLVAQGAGNLVAQGAGNLVPGRSTMSTGNKRVFVLQR